MLIELASLVETSDGEGFLVGRSLVGKPAYTVMTFDQVVAAPHTVRLVDAYPLDHPRLPVGLKPFIEQRLRWAQKPLQKLLDSEPIQYAK
jgi:hypothetical protein